MKGSTSETVSKMGKLDYHLRLIFTIPQYGMMVSDSIQSVISCLFREQSTLLSLGAGDVLRTVAFGLFREQA